MLAWTLYLGWLAVPVALVTWAGVEPLHSLRRSVGGSGGWAAAIGAGVAFLLVSRAVYDHLRARLSR